MPSPGVDRPPSPTTPSSASAAEPARGGPADRRGTIRADHPAASNVERRSVRRSWTPRCFRPGAPPDAGPSDVPAPVERSDLLRGHRAAPADATLVAVPVSGGDDPMIVRPARECRDRRARRHRARCRTSSVARPRPDPDAAVATAEPQDRGTSRRPPRSPWMPSRGRRPVCRPAPHRRRALRRWRPARGPRRARPRTRCARPSAPTTTTRRVPMRPPRPPTHEPSGAAKDAAQIAFRHDRAASTSTDEVEAAARAWLLEINRINGEARDAAAAVTREREAARNLTLELERLAVEADAARIAAETAEAACVAAREAAADCDERDAADRAAEPPPTGSSTPPFVDEPAPTRIAGDGGTPRIFRLLRGDRAAMTELVTAMAGDDPEERRRWQLTLSRPRRRDPRRQHRRGAPWTSPRATRSGDRSARPRTGTSPARSPRSGTGSTASAAGSTDASPPSATCRSPSATPASTRCASATGRPSPRWSTCSRDVTVAADEHLAGRGRRPDPGRARVDARSSRRRAGRRLERVGPPATAAARGALTRRPPASSTR